MKNSNFYILFILFFITTTISVAQTPQSIKLYKILNALENYKADPRPACKVSQKGMSKCLVDTIKSAKDIDFIIDIDTKKKLRDFGAKENLIQLITELSIKKLFDKVDFHIEEYDKVIAVRYSQTDSQIISYTEETDRTNLKDAENSNILACDLSEIHFPRFSGKCHYNYGRIYFKQQIYFRARYELEVAIYERGFHESIAKELLALCLTSMDLEGNLNKITALYKEIESEDPNYISVYINFGKLFSHRKQYSKAIEKYREALKRDKENSEILMLIGDTYLQNKEYKNAITIYSEAKILNNRSAKLYYNCGIAFLEEKKYQDAIDDFNTANTLNTKINLKHKIINKRGLAYIGMEKFDKAIEIYTNIISEVIENPEQFYTNRGIAYQKKNNHFEAVKDFTKAVKLNNNYAPAYLHRSFSYPKISYEELNELINETKKINLIAEGIIKEFAEKKDVPKDLKQEIKKEFADRDLKTYTELMNIQ